MKTDKINGLRRLPGILICAESGAAATTKLFLCVEVVNPATPATRLNLNQLTRNISRNTGATTRNNQPHSVHIQDKNRIGE
jgi:hypothetical protein